MKKYLTSFSKFIAVLFAIAFVVTTLATLFLYNVEKSAFNPLLYKKALIDEDIYDRLPSVIGEQLVISTGFEVCAQNPIACDMENRETKLKQCLEDALGDQAYLSLAWNERTPTDAELKRVEPCFAEFGYPTAQGEEHGLAPFMKNLTAKDWEKLIVSLVSPSELQQMTEETINQTFAFLDGDRSEVSIPMGLINKRLAGEEGLDALLHFLQAQPDCTFDDISQLQNLGSGGSFVYCNPPEEILPTIEPILQDELNNVSKKNPEGISFGQQVPLRTLVNTQTARWFMRMSPLFAIGLLLIITILVVRSPKSWLRWWGIPLLTAGVLGLFIGIASAPMIEFSLNMLIFGEVPVTISTSLMELIYDLTTSVLHGLTETIVLHALIIALLGLAMTIGAAFIKPATESLEFEN